MSATFTEQLRTWLSHADSSRAISAERAKLIDEPSIARIARIAQESSRHRWGTAPREAYDERLGQAADLGMKIGAGSIAEAIAAREARRVHAEIHVPSPNRDGPDLFDIALELFEPYGGLNLISLSPRPSPTSKSVTGSACPPGMSPP